MLTEIRSAPAPLRTAVPSNASLTVKTIVQRMLLQSPYRSLRALRCDYENGVLTLSGRLPTYYLKQVAQTLVAQAPGVRLVRNLIEVSYFEPGRRLASGY